MSLTANDDIFDELRCNATVSVPRAAEILGVSRTHGYWMVRNGRLPAIELGPRRVRVRSAGLLALLESGQSITPGRGNALSA